MRGRGRATCVVALGALTVACGTLDDRHPSMGGVPITTNVEEAELSVDGTVVSPAYTGVLLLEPGVHTVEVKDGPAVVARQQVQITAGQNATPIEARWPSAVVNTDLPRTTLFVDGVLEAPLDVQGVTMVRAPGTYTLEARTDDGTVQARDRIELFSVHVQAPLQVVLYPGTAEPPPAPAPTALDATAPPYVPPPGPTGVVTVDTTPPASILVDGQPAGRSPAQLNVAPGHHVIGLELPDGRFEVEPVDVTAGTTQRVVRRL